MGLLDNKVIIITGASRGIGKAIAQECVQQGAKVAFTYLSSEEKAKALEAELSNSGGTAKGFKSDASVFDEAQSLVDAVVEEFGTVDVLVNNAGITRDTLLMRMSEQQWDEVMNTNLKSAFNLTKAVQRTMLKARSGSIINMSSVASSIKGAPNRLIYGTTKAAVIGLTKAVATDYITQGIRCNCICPGTVDSPSLHQRLEATGDYNKAMKDFIARQPMGRIGYAEEIAALAVYLGSDESNFTTGHAHVIDGGWSN